MKQEYQQKRPQDPFEQTLRMNLATQVVLVDDSLNKVIEDVIKKIARD